MSSCKITFILLKDFIYKFIYFNNYNLKELLINYFPAPDCPKMKLSGLNSYPKTPPLTESNTPGSKSTNTDLGTNLPPVASLKYTLILSNYKSDCP